MTIRDLTGDCGLPWFRSAADNTVLASVCRTGHYRSLYRLYVVVNRDQMNRELFNLTAAVCRTDITEDEHRHSVAGGH
jgi:hypothetical protein